MSLFTVLVFLAGVIAGFFLTCIMVVADDGDHDCMLAYKEGYEEGYRQGKKEREE